jgi:hypothetical protein
MGLDSNQAGLQSCNRSKGRHLRAPPDRLTQPYSINAIGYIERLMHVDLWLDCSPFCITHQIIVMSHTRRVRLPTAFALGPSRSPQYFRQLARAAGIPRRWNASSSSRIGRMSMASTLPVLAPYSILPSHLASPPPPRPPLVPQPNI